MNADMGSEQDQDSFGAEFQNFYEIRLKEDITEINKVKNAIIEVKGHDSGHFEYTLNKQSILIDKDKAEILKKMIKAVK
ncbi:MAG: hypothetical protein KDD94_00265 [Calditrichaeota bacterium]|nr:hypothetical protein [Calditrichota bacterium]